MKIKILTMLILCLFVVGCETKESEKTADSGQILEETKNPVPDTGSGENAENEQIIGQYGLSESQCVDAGGNWNECGSPCAGTGSDFCIQSCEVHCECGGIAGFSCPEGYSCRLSGTIADEMGVCVPEDS